MRSSRGTLIAIAALFSSGCASALVSPPPAPVAPPVEVKPADPLGDYAGMRRPSGEEFRLLQAPVGISDLGVIVRVIKAEWVEMDGERSATAIIEVKRGETQKTLYMEEGQTKSALGVRIHVRATGETYDKETMRYPAFADLTVTAD